MSLPETDDYSGASRALGRAPRACGPATRLRDARVERLASARRADARDAGRARALRRRRRVVGLARVRSRAGAHRARDARPTLPRRSWPRDCWQAAARLRRRPRRPKDDAALDRGRHAPHRRVRRTRRQGLCALSSADGPAAGRDGAGDRAGRATRRRAAQRHHDSRRRRRAPHRAARRRARKGAPRALRRWRRAPRAMLPARFPRDSGAPCCGSTPSSSRASSPSRRAGPRWSRPNAARSRSATKAASSRCSR